MKKIILSLTALLSFSAMAVGSNYTCSIDKETKVYSEIKTTGLVVMKAEISRSDMKLVRIYEGPLSLILSNNFGHELTLEATLRDEKFEPVKPLETMSVKLNIKNPELNPEKIERSIKINDVSELKVVCDRE